MTNHGTPSASKVKRRYSDDDNNDDDNNDKPKRKRWPTLSLLPRLPVMPGKLNGKVFFNGAMMVRLDE